MFANSWAMKLLISVLESENEGQLHWHVPSSYCILPLYSPQVNKIFCFRPCHSLLVCPAVTLSLAFANIQYQCVWLYRAFTQRFNSLDQWVLLFIVDKSCLCSRVSPQSMTDSTGSWLHDRGKLRKSRLYANILWHSSVVVGLEPIGII